MQMPGERFMRRRRFTICYILIITIIMTSVTFSQTPAGTKGNWEAVKALNSGDWLIVELKGRINLQGTLVSASDTVLRLYIKDTGKYSTRQDILDIKRDEIAKVHRVNKKSLSKPMLVGMAAGGALGAVIGSKMGSCPAQDFLCTNHKGPATMIMAAGGAAIGSGIGLLIGAARLKRVLIYD
jgi:hypothetical protein